MANHEALFSGPERASSLLWVVIWLAMLVLHAGLMDGFLMTRAWDLS